MPVTLCATCGTDELVGHRLKFQRTATAAQFNALGMKKIMEMIAPPMDAQIKVYDNGTEGTYVRDAPINLGPGGIVVNALFTPTTVTCPVVKADPIGPGNPNPQAEPAARK